MNSRTLKEMISVIRSEEQRRASLLRAEDAEVGYDLWLFEDGPFVNELCMMLLVAVQHQVERALVRLAARAADEGTVINRSQFSENLKQLRKGLSWNWKEISDRLKPMSSEWYPYMNALRLLANSYKHDPFAGPAEDLKRLLDLPNVNYADLPASSLVREKLAAFIGLGEEATYCDVAERFVDIAESFLADVEGRATMSPIEPRIASSNPEDFLH